MKDVEGEIVRESRRSIVLQERFAESLGFSFGNHAASARGDGHGTGAAQDLQLHRSALYAGDAQSHSPIVDLVVGIVLNNSGSERGKKVKQRIFLFIYSYVLRQNINLVSCIGPLALHV